jgi:flagellar hook-associated protein FlgK
MDTLSVAASGLRSAEIRLEAAAHNTANLGTEGVRPLRVIQEEHEAGGSTARVVRAESPRSVDSVEALVEQLRASYQYTASARLLAVELDMRGRITDMLV